jgi:hypothetical protein
MSNEAFKALTALAVFVEIAALVYALRRRDLRAILFVNLAGAATIMLVQLPHLGLAIENADLGALALLAFALVTAATSLLWFAYPKWLSHLAWLEFSICSLLSLTLATFAFTFQMMRMM